MAKVTSDFTQNKKYQDVGRWYITKFVQEIANILPAGSLILDAGAGECAYKKYFSDFGYESIDLGVGDSEWNYETLDHVGPLHDMPISSGKYDAVLCTQVLEHLEWPRESVCEMFRVLKPGGKLFMTVPMAHEEHQTPYDFFRYTSYGIRSICDNAGFKRTTVKPFGGIAIRLAYELPALLNVYPVLMTDGRGGGFVFIRKIMRLFFRSIVGGIQVFLIWSDRFDSKKNYPFGWSVIAEK